MSASPSEHPEKSRDSLILHATDNAVSWITLNRPEAMNAITPDQRERLIHLLADASADPAVRAVVITATGRGFCAGTWGARRPATDRRAAAGHAWPVTWRA